MINAIIVDDEEACRENLKVLLGKYCPDVKVVATAENADKAKNKIDTYSPELILLDIEMPYGNGFDLLEKYEHVPFEIIFVTAFDKYALKAIRMSACDYLLKPIGVSELISAINRVTRRIALKVENKELKHLLSNLRTVNGDRKIALPSVDGLTFIKVSDVIRCEAEGRYTWFYFTNHEKILVTKNIGEYEELLVDKDFVRIHHAHLVNLHHVRKFKKGNSPTLIMSDHSSVVVSQRKRDLLLKKLSASY